MKIEVIGSFNDQGNPVGWSINTISKSIAQNLPVSSVIKILVNKVYVNGVEIVEWTEKRLKMMG